MTFLQRIGAALVAPREAAREARASDVAWLLGARVVAGETPRLARALVRGFSGEPVAALTAIAGAASAVLPDVLGILIGAILLSFFVGRERRRDRTLDVAANAWVPYLAVHLVGALVWSALQRPMRPSEEGVIDALAVLWSVLVWSLGLIELRRERAA